MKDKTLAYESFIACLHILLLIPAQRSDKQIFCKSKP